MRSSVTKNDDFIYYNGTVTNDQSPFFLESFLKADFYDQRTISILEKADDYVMSVVRWSLPTASLPLCIFHPIPFLPDIPFLTPNTNPNFTTYSVGLNWFNGTTYVDFVNYIMFIPQNPEDAPSPFISQTVDNEAYWYVYSYQQILNMINAAYLDCFTRLKVAYPGAPPTAAPRIVYNATTGNYSMIAQDAYQAPALNPGFESDPDPNIRFGSQTTITVWMGLNTWNDFFDPAWNIDFAGVNNISLPDPSSGYIYNKASRIIIQNNTGLPNTGTTTVTTEFPVVGNPISLRNVVLTSNTLPARFESINPSTINGSSSSSNTLQIISDFSYDVFTPGQALSARTGIIYSPSIYRFTNLLSDSRLDNISVSAQYLDSNNVSHPVFLKSGTSFNFKIMFVKKNKLKDFISQGMKVEMY